MTLERDLRLAAADRYGTLAGQTPDPSARAALAQAAAELEVSGDPVASKPDYLQQRYEEEMRAAGVATSRQAKIAHLELALRYAVRARSARLGATR